MRDVTIARAYAAALFEAGEASGEVETYGPPLREVADLFGDARIRRFFDTPRISDEARRTVMREVLDGRVPDRLLRFLLVVLDRGRQGVLPEIAEAYQEMLDRRSGRYRAHVTLARRLDGATEALITERLSGLFGQPVEPEISINPAILGGLIARYGDRLLDASLRRHLVALRRELMDAHLPETPAGAAQGS